MGYRVTPQDVRRPAAKHTNDWVGWIPWILEHALQGFSVGKTYIGSQPDPRLTLMSSPAVKCSVGNITMPTYPIGPENPNPPFRPLKLGRRVEKIYPYTLQDSLLSIREDRAHRAVFLENPYLKLIILPDVGGRVYSAYDKVGKRETFYRNNVFKPALIALRGAWISGGIEFNYCSTTQHSPITVSPVDFSIRENPDGSVTVLVGDIEKITYVKWLVGVTLYPDKAYLETEVRLFNSTPTRKPYYFWSNAAAPATNGLRFIYPMKKAYFEATGGSFPIHQGVDISLYKNHPTAISIFARDCKDDFFGSYDHDTDEGTIHVANHFECVGKKIFTWGTEERGLLWANILSDAEGPYTEIQSGKLETQSDFELIEPHSILAWKEYWYPIRGIGPFNYANKDAALSLHVGPGEGATKHVRLGLYSTQRVKDGTLTLKAGGREVYKKGLDIGPENPFRDELGIEAVEEEFTLAFAVNGKELASYTWKKPSTEPQAEAASAPSAKSVEELYLSGLDREKHGLELDAASFYNDALKADPGFSPAYCGLGVLDLKMGLYGEAEAKFRKALERAPNSSEAHYYLGFTLKKNGREKEAEGELWKAVESRSFASPAYYLLAEIALVEGDAAEVETLLRRALASNSEDVGAAGLLATALRMQGRECEGLEMAERALRVDPIDLLLNAEVYFGSLQAGRAEAAERARQWMSRLLSRQTDSYLMLAARYGSIGLYDEAVTVLGMASEAPSWVGRDPLIHIHLGYYLAKQGRDEEALKSYTAASDLEPDFVFPHLMESAEALTDAISANAKDWKAHYYLGNLLFGRHRYEEAIAEWLKAAELTEGFSVLHRNLGLAFKEIRSDLAKAAEAYEKAVGYARNDPTLYIELDQVYEALQLQDRRLKLLENAPPDILTRGDIAQRLASLYVEIGDYGRAAKLLGEVTFTPREGYLGVRAIYEEAYMSRGKQRFEARDLAGAVEDFHAAMEYPANIGVGAPAKRRDAEALGWLAVTYEALGNTDKARECWEKTVLEDHRAQRELDYYSALALQKMGRDAEATNVLRGLVEYADAGIRFRDDPMFHLMKGLAYKGLGETENAKAELTRALEWSPRNRRFRREVERLTKKP